MTAERISTFGFPRLAWPIRVAIARTRTWHRRSRTRRQLSWLDSRQLRDVGITEADRRQECAKWFWQI
jgi:uncharacterized protein YjiS (DUF1127 family)